MISSNYVPEKINEYNVYMDGEFMVGVVPDVDLPEIGMRASDVEGSGMLGLLNSPTIGQFESMEQEIKFNVLYSSAINMLNPLEAVNLTFRAAQQVYNKSGGYVFKGLRIVEQGRVKKFKPGKMKRAEGMEATVTMELTYILVEVDGVVMMEIDKLNQKYIVNGKDMLAGIRELV